MKKLLVIAAGILQIPIIKKAKEMGYYVIAADGNDNAPGFLYSNKKICANITDEEVMLHIAKEEKIDGVIHPCSEVAMNVMGRINDELGLSGISKQIAINATNKFQMRRIFEMNSVSSPQSICLSDVDALWNVFNDKFNGPAIIKPSRSSGSRGVAKIEKDISLMRFREFFQRALNESRDSSVLLEQFIGGVEFSVEVLVCGKTPYVLSVTDKLTTNAPYFVELGHSQPSLYPNEIIEKVTKVACDGVIALDLNNCAAHVEVKVDNGVAYIIEIGARLGGDFITSDLTYISTGIDMVAAAINLSLGEVPNLNPSREKKSVCIRYFCPKPGKLVKIDNLDRLNNPNVYSSDIYVKRGDVIEEIKSSNNRSGHVITIADTPQEAINIAENIIKEVSFTTI